MMLNEIILFCIPYAGGSAESLNNITFRLRKFIDIEVLELPGRGKRRHEPLCDNLETIVEEFYNTICNIVSHSDKTIFIWGHSMGGLIAFLLAQKLEKYSRCSFGGLIISAMTSPVKNPNSAKKLHLLPKEDFIRYFEKLVPPSKINMDERIRSIMVERMESILRADVTAIENYNSCNWTSMIAAPVYLLRGNDDEIMSLEENYNSWKSHTTGTVKLYNVEGGHFFILDYPKITANIIQKIIAEYVENLTISNNKIL